MTTLHKALPFALLLLAALGLPLAAQSAQNDCSSFTFTFTGNATQTGVANLSQNSPCVNWRLTFSTTGTLSTTVTFEISPDNSTWTAVPNTICSATVQPPCVLQGANPTTGTQGTAYISAYGAYVHVTATSSSGTGNGVIRVYGAKGATASALPSSGGGGGSGTVTSLATGCGLSGGTITVSGTIIESWLLDPQNGAGAFAIPSADCGKIISRNQAGAVSDTIAQAGGTFPTGWHLFYQCMGAGGCTITPATSTINTVASLALTQGQGVLIVSDGANYTSQGTTAAGGGSGTVTNTGTLTANAVILGNGGVDVKPGAVLPADATKFYNGAGAFATPPTASAVPAASNLTPVTVSANTTADQTLQEVALTAGILNTVNAANLIHGSGILTIATLQTPALTFKAKLCTVSGCGSGTVLTLATITSGASIAATNNGWNLQLMVGTVSIGASGTLSVHGAPGLTVDIGALPGSAATLYVDTNTTVTAAIDLTAALFVDFTVSTSAGNAGNSFTQSIAESLPWTGAGGGTVGFLHSRSLTIDHTLCGSSDATNFPVLVSLSNTTFKTVPNGGHIQNSSGFDIVFAADAGAVTKYPWEVESYDPVNGVLVAWVQVPTVSHTVDTVFYVLYDNTAITTAQNTGSLAPTAVWDSNYVGVWHLPNGTTLTANDSTSNAINGTLTNAPTATAGQIDGGGAFVNASNQNINLGSGASLQITGALTIEAWVVRSTNSTVRLFSNVSSYPNGYDVYADSGVLFFQTGARATSPALSSGVPAHFVATHDGGTTGIAYINGVAGTPATMTAPTAGGTALIGAYPAGGGQTWTGVIDEFRLSKIARSPDWILTEYNNQFLPGNIGSPSFITYGAEI